MSRAVLSTDSAGMDLILPTTEGKWSQDHSSCELGPEGFESLWVGYNYCNGIGDTQYELRCHLSPFDGKFHIVIHDVRSVAQYVSNRYADHPILVRSFDDWTDAKDSLYELLEAGSPAKYTHD